MHLFYDKVLLLKVVGLEVIKILSCITAPGLYNLLYLYTELGFDGYFYWCDWPPWLIIAFPSIPQWLVILSQPEDMRFCKQVVGESYP